MAKLDFTSIVLVVLAVLIAPIVVGLVLRLFRAEKRTQDRQIDLYDQTDL